MDFTQENYNGDDDNDHVDDNQDNNDLIKTQDYNESEQVNEELPVFNSADMPKIIAKPSGNMVRLKCQARGEF